MDCCANLGRVFVVLINIIFMLLSLAFLVIGCILKFGWNTVLGQYIQPMVESLKTAAKDAGSSISSTNSFDFSIIISDLAIAMIVIGVVFLVLAIFGCCGACCKIKCMLILYVIICITLLLAQIIFVIILFNSNIFQEKVKAPLIKTVKDKYAGFNGTDVISLGMNFVMISLKCCGIQNYKDFTGAPKWHNTYKVEKINMTKTLIAPVFCCKLKGTFPDVKPPDNYNCTFEPTITNSNYQKGCFKAVEEWLLNYKNYVIGVGVAVLVLQLLLIGFSIYILVGLNREKVRPV